MGVGEIKRGVCSLWCVLTIRYNIIIFAMVNILCMIIIIMYVSYVCEVARAVSFMHLVDVNILVIQATCGDVKK